MNAPDQSVNAWIFLAEDEPPNTSYKSPGSCYQSLISNNVYKSTDMLDICFFNTVVTGRSTVPAGDGSSYTIEIGPKTHPDGSSNQEYLEWTIRDARAVNPQVKLLATLDYSDDELSKIFASGNAQKNADAFASNLLAYLKNYDLDGFDVDWEGSFAFSITQEQFAILFTAIRAQFSTQSRHYYLTLSPASVGNLDADTVNSCFDYVNLQLYSGFTSPGEFTAAGVNQELLAYGAKFESIGNGITRPYQNAQSAYNGYRDGNYKVLTQWRLNSGDYQYEQAQQMILHELIEASPTGPFDDTDTMGAAGNPPITQMRVRSGDVLDSILVTNTGSFDSQAVAYTLPQHGGDGGSEYIVTLQPGDVITEISGYTGIWFGHECVLQLNIKTQSGQSYGPFGTMNNGEVTAPFTYQAPPQQAVVAFSGSVVNVPLAGGGTTDIISALKVSFADQ